MAVEWSDRILLTDLADEPALSEELNSVVARLSETEEKPDVVLNFSEVSYLNSSNIAQVLRLRKLLVEDGRSLVLCGVGDAVWSTMLLTGLDKVLRFTPNKATAIASLQMAERDEEA